LIVFVDESGLSQQPHRVRTWAPKGCTPVLQYHFNWKTFSVMAGLTVCNFYFQLFDGSIKSPQVIAFLRHLRRHLRGKLLIVWDGAGIHRSRLVREFLVSLRGRLEVEYLPAYAPELNPTEYIWGHLKQHELANVCARHGWELSLRATRALRRMRRRPALICAFWKQAELW
jgi:transposase